MKRVFVPITASPWRIKDLCKILTQNLHICWKEPVIEFNAKQPNNKVTKFGLFFWSFLRIVLTAKHYIEDISNTWNSLQNRFWASPFLIKNVFPATFMFLTSQRKFIKYINKDKLHLCIEFRRVVLSTIFTAGKNYGITSAIPCF